MRRALLILLAIAGCDNRNVEITSKMGHVKIDTSHSGPGPGICINVEAYDEKLIIPILVPLLIPFERKAVTAEKMP